MNSTRTALMLENKYRGPLNQEKLETLLHYLRHHGKLVREENERAVYFDGSIFPQIGDFNTGFSRISMKFKKSHSEMRLKIGNPSEPRREKIIVKVSKKQTKNLLLILNKLGLKNGYYRPALRSDFELYGTVVSIKTHCVMGDHFEINGKNKAINANQCIGAMISELGLSFWTREHYQKRINRLMKKAPPVNICDSHLFD